MPLNIINKEEDRIPLNNVKFRWRWAFVIFLLLFIGTLIWLALPEETKTAIKQFISIVSCTAIVFTCFGLWLTYQIWKER